MDRETRQKLVDAYKDGYRVVAEALAGTTDAELDASPGAGKWTRASDRPSPRRQRDDLRHPSAPAHRVGQPGHRRLRPGRVRAPAVLHDRPDRAPRSTRSRPPAAATAEILDRMSEARVAARRHAHRARPLHRLQVARNLRRPCARARGADPRRTTPRAKSGSGLAGISGSASAVRVFGSARGCQACAVSPEPA